MKALVLEIREDKAAILTSEGQIIKVDNKQYRVGQEITFKGPREKIVDMTRYVKRWGTAIAAALFLFVTLSLSYVTLKPYGVVSLDVNPSIEFTINRFDRVLNVSGVNDDGKDILSCLNEKRLLYKNIEQAVDITINTLRAEGYLREEKDNYVVVAANTNKESHTDKLVGRLDQSISKQDNIEPIAMKASDDELMAARELGTTPGKMMIVEKLDNSSKEKIDKSNWVNKSVASIVKECDKNNSANLAASAETLKNTAKPTETHSNAIKAKANTGSGSAYDTDGNSGENKRTNESVSSPMSSRSQKTQASSKGSAADKNKDSSESAAKTSAPPSAPSANDSGSGTDVTAVGTSSEPTPAPTTPVPATPVPTMPADPVVTPVPTAVPTPDPAVVTPAPTPVPTVPETPVIPTVPETPVVQPVTPADPTPSEPAQPSTPSQPSEPSSPSTPSQPSEPSSPSTPSEPEAPSPSENATPDQAPSTNQEMSSQGEEE